MEKWKLRLKQAREAKGLNKTEFARLAKVSNPTVTDWEKSVSDGGIKEIAGANLTRICSLLDVNPHWIMDGSGPMQVAPAEMNAAPGTPDSRLAGALELRAETAAELRLLTAHRLAGDDHRKAIDRLADIVLAGIKTGAVGHEKK